MNVFGIGLLAFACLFGGALLGMRLRSALPHHHLSGDSAKPLELGLAIVGTMAGLVLGLLVASATSAYIAQRSELLRIWPQQRAGIPELDPSAEGAETILDQIEDLAPTNDAQRSLKSEAVGLSLTLGQIRWLMYEQTGSSLSMPLLVLLIFWFTITFVGFGLFSPPSAPLREALAHLQ
jgi:ABC-type amino acid transport system permease subunit